MNIEDLAHLHYLESLTESKTIKNEAFPQNGPENSTKTPARDKIKSGKTENASKWNLIWKLGRNWKSFQGPFILNAIPIC